MQITTNTQHNQPVRNSRVIKPENVGHKLAIITLSDFMGFEQPKRSNQPKLSTPITMAEAKAAAGMAYEVSSVSGDEYGWNVIYRDGSSKHVTGDSVSVNNITHSYTINGTDEQLDSTAMRTFMNGGESKLVKTLGKATGDPSVTEDGKTVQQYKKGTITIYQDENGGAVTEFMFKDGSKHIYVDYGCKSYTAGTFQHIKRETFAPDGTRVLYQDVEIPN